MHKKHCLGCEDDYYNDKNPFGVKECWSLKNAKLIKRKRVPVNQTPPWKQKMEKLPSCYKKKGYVFFDDDREY